ncbi:MAG: hypothetical protein GWP05_04105 [Anaerolineaceae bacterium]|nr:hypothetical protein [Anaerolineaceae bacterium]
MKVREHLSGFVIVLVMTLIVWVVADRSVLRTSREMTVGVNVSVLDKAQYRATVVDPANRQMKVRFQGPGRAIDQLESRREAVTFQYTLSDAEAERAIETGSLIVPAREGFRTQDLVRNRITLDRASPQKVTIRVEKVQQRPVPVKLSPEVVRMVAEGWTADPTEVVAELSLSAWEKLEREGRQLSAYPQINLNAEQALARKETTQKANLMASIPGLDVRFVPRQASVTFQLTAPQDKRTMGPIPILVTGPVAVLDTYEVVIEDGLDVELVDPPDAVLKNLRITGPASEVAELTSDKVLVLLVLEKGDQPAKSFKDRTLEIRFPEGSRVRFDEDFPRPRVNFNLKPRAAKKPEPTP